VKTSGVASAEGSTRVEEENQEELGRTDLKSDPGNLRDVRRRAVENRETSLSTQDSDLGSSERADHSVLERRGRKRRSVSSVFIELSVLRC